MKSLIFGILLLPALSWAQAQEKTPAKKQFCKSRLISTDSMQRHVSSRLNQLSFYNQGGFLNGGVCWWHSRFTRAAAYLGVFEPSLPRPTDDEAKKIIENFRKRKSVVVVPGYKNLYDFSLSYGREILHELTEWQRSDGVLKFKWITGLKGNSAISAEELETRMNDLYDRVKKGEVVYQMLQMPSVVAHAWLVVGIEKAFDGYELKIVDSNSQFGGTETYRYRTGETKFEYNDLPDSHFVPYTQEIDEEIKLRTKLTKECEESVSRE